MTFALNPIHVSHADGASSSSTNVPNIPNSGDVQQGDGQQLPVVLVETDLNASKGEETTDSFEVQEVQSQLSQDIPPLPNPDPASMPVLLSNANDTNNVNDHIMDHMDHMDHHQVQQDPTVHTAAANAGDDPHTSMVVMQDVPIMDANSTTYSHLSIENDNHHHETPSSMPAVATMTGMVPFLTTPDGIPYHPSVSPVAAAPSAATGGALPPAAVAAHQDGLHGLQLQVAMEQVVQVPTTTTTTTTTTTALSSTNPNSTSSNLAPQSHIILVQNSNEKQKSKLQHDNTTPRRQQREAKWDIMYSYLVQYKDIHGDCLVPNRYKPLPQLGNWVSTQRRHYNAISTGGISPLSMEKVELLNKIGFVWKTKDPRHIPWEVRYEELKSYKEKMGDCLVPVGYQENPKLSNWVSTQRQEYKFLKEHRNSRLTAERVKLLDELEFVWEAQRGGGRKRSGRPKKVKLVESQKDGEQSNSLSVSEPILPVQEPKEETRVDMKKDKEDDKAKGPPKRSWISLFKDLLWYQRSYGDTFVPRNFPGIPDLGPFVAFQRQQYTEMNKIQSEAPLNNGTADSINSPIPSEAVTTNATTDAGTAESDSTSPKDKHILTPECKKLLNSIEFDWDWVEPPDYKPASVVDIKYKGNSINTREIVINEGIPIKQVVEEDVEGAKKDDTRQVKRKRGRPRKVQVTTPEDNESSSHEAKDDESDGKEKTDDDVSKKRNDEEKTDDDVSKKRKRSRKNAKAKAKAAAKRALPTRKSARKKGKVENDAFAQAYAIDKAKKKKKGNKTDLEEAAAALFSLSSNRP